MALSPEKKAQLEAIEVWNEKGAGARLRGRHSRSWLEENGFLKRREAAPADAGTDSGDTDSGKPARKSKGPTTSGAARPGTAGKYFGAK
jgi:hypothetical protein